MKRQTASTKLNDKTGRKKNVATTRTQLEDPQKREKIAYCQKPTQHEELKQIKSAENVTVQGQRPDPNKLTTLVVLSHE